MKALVLGSKGFLGRHVLTDLADQFGSSRVYSLCDDTDALPEKNCRSYRIEAKNYDSILNFAIEKNISHIVNCAGTIGETKKMAADYEAASVLSALMKSLPKKPIVIHVGSASEQYKILDCREAPEPPDLSRLTEYGARKFQVSKLLSEGSRAPGECFQLITLLVHNMIGPNMHKGTIPGKIYSEVFLGGKKTIHFAGLGARRDYIDVRDVSSLITAFCLKKDLTCENVTAYVGSGRLVRVRDVIAEIRLKSGFSFDFVEADDQVRPGVNTIVYEACLPYLKESVGWGPSFELSESIDYLLSNYAHQ